MQESLLKTCAREFHTPLYVYDFDAISIQLEKFKNAFKARKSLICYALKANPNLSVINHLASLGCGADCVSIGEVRRAIAGGVPKYKIIYSGVGKRDDEIESALKLGILFLNVESEAELLRIESIAQSLESRARISIRVNPNIDAKTHPYISTGLHENKFGVDIELAKRLYIYAKQSPFLEPVGIHFHIGSQLTALEPLIQSAKIIADLAHSLLALKIDLKFFDIGGGIGICYTDEQEIDLYEYAQGILEAIKGLDVTIICEPGRFLVGSAGVLLSKVLYEKHNGSKRFVIVDAAMNDLMRPALYNAVHNVRIIESCNTTTLESRADIVGAICESSDFLAKDVVVPALASGDLLAFENAGAYGASMAHTYNTRSRPAEVGIQKGKYFLLKERESFEEMTANELRLLHKRLEQ